MTLTWREELALQIKGIRALLERDLQELDRTLEAAQVHLLEEDKEVRHVRRLKQKSIGIRDSTSAPGQGLSKNGQVESKEN